MLDNSVQFVVHSAAPHSCSKTGLCMYSRMKCCFNLSAAIRLCKCNFFSSGCYICTSLACFRKRRVRMTATYMYIDVELVLK